MKNKTCKLILVAGGALFVSVGAAQAVQLTTKNYVDTGLATKADAADVYTQTEIGTLLDEKADKVDTGTDPSAVGRLAVVGADGNYAPITVSQMQTLGAHITEQLDVQTNLSGPAGEVVVFTGTAGEVDSLAVDSAVTSASSNLVTSGAVAAAMDAIDTAFSTDLDGKQNEIAAGTAGEVMTFTGTAGTVGSLAIDSTVTSASSNLVTSGAVADAVATVQSATSIVGGADAGKALVGTVTGYEWIEIVDTYGL